MATSRLTTDEFQQSLTIAKAPALLQRLLQTEMQPNDIAELLKSKDQDGWTLGIIIARHQNATTTQQYLRLLEKLLLEDLAAHLKCQSKNGNTLGMFIADRQDATTTQHYMRLLEKLSPEDFATHLNCQNKNGSTLGTFLAEKQSTATTQQYLRLLEKLSLEDLAAHLKYQTYNGWTLGMIIAHLQDATTTQHYMRLLERLSPEDFATHLNCQNKNGSTLGMITAEFQDATTTQHYLKLLEKLSSQDLTAHLNCQNKHGSTLGMLIADRQDASTTQHYLKLLEKLSPQDLTTHLKCRNKHGNTLGMCVVHFQGAATTQLFYSILIKQAQQGIAIHDMNAILSQSNEGNKSIYDLVKDKNAYQRFYTRLQRIYDAGSISTKFQEINENKYPAERLPTILNEIIESRPEYLKTYLTKLETQFNHQVEEQSRQKYRNLIAFVQLLINYPDRIDQTLSELATNHAINLDEPHCQELRDYINQRRQINRYVSNIFRKLNEIKDRINHNKWQVNRFGFTVNGLPKTMGRILKALVLMQHDDNASILNAYRQTLDLLAKRKKVSSSRAPETDAFYSAIEKELKSILFNSPDQAALDQLNPATQPPPTFIIPVFAPVDDPPAYDTDHHYVTMPATCHAYTILPAAGDGHYPVIINASAQAPERSAAEAARIQHEVTPSISTSQSSLFATPALHFPPVPCDPLPPVDVSEDNHQVEHRSVRQILTA